MTNIKTFRIGRHGLFYQDIIVGQRRLRFFGLGHSEALQKAKKFIEKKGLSYVR